MGSGGLDSKEELADARSSGDRSTIVRPHCEIPLRVLGLVVAFVAIVLIRADKETKIVLVSLIESLPPLQVPVTAKWHYLSAFVYLLVINAIACTYAAGSLIVTLLGQRSKTKTNANARLMVILLDMVMTTLLFSGLGAAAGVGVVGRYGNSHVQWKEVCTIFDGYCRQMTSALVLTFAECLVFLWLVVLAVLNLHRANVLAS